MLLQRLGFISAGGMTETVLTTLAATLDGRLERLSVLVLPGFEGSAKRLLDRTSARIAAETRFHTSLDQYLADMPEMVVECAGHMAVRQYGKEILRAGIHLLAISIGVFADEAFRSEVEAAASAGQAKLIGRDWWDRCFGCGPPLRPAGGYVHGRKPPNAWFGTPAERVVDLARLTKETVFFTGTARDAANNYPQNANVAATVALAGNGFDETRVRLIADPTISRNIHEVSVRSGCADFVITLQGRASPNNPKTSLTAGFRIAREILDQRSSIVI